MTTNETQTTDENTYSVGSRLSYTDMATVLGREIRVIKRLEPLRAAAKHLGIRRIKNGLPLYFTVMTKSELTELLNPVYETFISIKHNITWRPLVKIAVEDLAKSHEKINPKYPDRMDPAEYREYKAELAIALAGYMTVIQEDRPIERKPRKRVKSVSNPGLEVGMKISPYMLNGLGATTISKISDKSFWITEDASRNGYAPKTIKLLFRGNEGVVDLIIKENSDL